jgi:hypothetical protein
MSFRQYRHVWLGLQPGRQRVTERQMLVNYEHANH